MESFDGKSRSCCYYTKLTSSHLSSHYTYYPLTGIWACAYQIYVCYAGVAPSYVDFFSSSSSFFLQMNISSLPDSTVNRDAASVYGVMRFRSSCNLHTKCINTCKRKHSNGLGCSRTAACVLIESVGWDFSDSYSALWFKGCFNSYSFLFQTESEQHTFSSSGLNYRKSSSQGCVQKTVGRSLCQSS